MASNKKKNLVKPDSTIGKIISASTHKTISAPPKNTCKISIQDTIPIFAVHEDYNLIESYPGFYTRTYEIGENNYQTETEDVEKTMFIKYRAVLNSLGTNCEYGVTIFNKDINLDVFRESALKKETGDNLDFLRRELNTITTDRIKEGRNGIEKKKYVTLGVHAQDAKKAYDVFNRRLDRDLNTRFSKIKSYAKPIPLEEKLEILHDIYNMNEQGEFLVHTKVMNEQGVVEDVTSFDFDNMRSMGCTVKDMIAPSSIQFFNSYMRIGRKFVRVMKIDHLPSSLMDDFFVKLTDVTFNMLTTINVQPLPQRDANHIVHKNLILARQAKADERRGLIQNNLPEDMISPDTEDKVRKAEELREEMTENDEKLFKTTYTLLFWADSLEELQENTETIISYCQGATVGVHTMYKQQEQGFNSTLPLCHNEIRYSQKRTLKSSSAATICQPFSNLELSDAGGINYSMNLITKNLILYDRLATQNFNGFILGTPGCFTGETEIVTVDGKNPDGSFKYKIMSFNDMYLSEKASFDIVSCDPTTGEFKVGKARQVRITKYVTDLVKVRLSNGKTETCTPDHLWMTSLCDYVCAKDLKPGTKLKSADENISVKSVYEFKTKLPTPVYDLEEENKDCSADYENFLLASGVIVHNSGKSFTAKVEMLNVILGSNSDCIVIDPEAEYLALAKLIGGEIIKIEPGGKWHINPMEINVNYEFSNSTDWDEDDNTETNPILAKSDFILKLMETLVKTPFGLNSIQETIIDECVQALYAPFVNSNGNLKRIPPEKMPTLTDLQILLSGRKEPEARELSYALKMYTGSGSLNTFGFRSNVDIYNRFVVFNIKDVGEKLKPLAMLIILDAIQNRLFQNRQRGKFTWFWIDEIYLLFQSEETATFLNVLFKRARKYGGVPTGITQNVEDLLESDTARKMLSNCNFVQILNQAPSDREKLQGLLQLSESQIDVITSAPKGQGLIFTGTNTVPFYSVFPKDNSIYRCLTSNMKEIKEYEEEDRRRLMQEKKSAKKRESIA